MIPATAPRTSEPAVRTPRALTGVIVGAAFLLTTGLRLLGVKRSGDLFVDEVIYYDLSVSVSGGGFPRTDKALFFLHPPGFFYLRAGWGKLLGGFPDAVAGVYEGRVLNALLAGVTAAVLVLLVTRVARWEAGLVAGLLFAVDPFCIRQNNYAILETSTMMWVSVGYLLLLPVTREPAPRRAERRAAAAGLCFGLAILTRDQAFMITVLPLALAVTLRWGPPRRPALLCGAVAMSCYAVYVTLVAAAGHFGTMWDSKTHGLRRLLGLVQETGFNAPHGNALSVRLYNELPTFWPTYLLLLLGPFAFLVLARRTDNAQRLLALFQMSAGVSLAYAVVLGTLEEKFLYLFVVPNLAVVTVAASILLTGRRVRLRQPAGRRRRLLLPAAAVLLLVAVVAASSVSYANSRLRQDDAFAQLNSYLTDHVPRGSTVIGVDGDTTAGITWWTFKNDYRVKRPDGDRTGDRYAVIPWKLVGDGYAEVTPKEARALVKGGTVLFTAHSDTYGKLTLYRLPAPPKPPLPEQRHAPR